MKFIPTYTDWGRKVHPDFKDRTILMLSDHFGYDYEELEDVLRTYEREFVEAGMTEVEAFKDFLFEAIEGDLSIQPKED